MASSTAKPTAVAAAPAAADGKAKPIVSTAPKLLTGDVAAYDIHFYYTAETRATAEWAHSELAKACPFLSFGRLIDRPIGPHTLPMWEADIENSADVNEHFGRAV